MLVEGVKEVGRKAVREFTVVDKVCFCVVAVVIPVIRRANRE